VRRSPALAILAIVVAVLVIAMGFASGRSSGGPTAELVDYAASADGLRLVVTAIVPQLCDVDRIVGDESTTAVRVTVTLTCRGAPSAASAPLVDVPVTLRTPLGSRAVLDANGSAVAPRSP
jgi:hypothetical protein